MISRDDAEPMEPPLMEQLVADQPNPKSALDESIALLDQIKHEIKMTEDTTFLNPEELGWLGALRETQHNVAMDENGQLLFPLEPLLAQCKRCQGMVLASRCHVHQCRPPPTVTVRVRPSRRGQSRASKKKKKKKKI